LPVNHAKNRLHHTTDMDLLHAASFFRRVRDKATLQGAHRFRI
jgi:hypothetical protein